MWKKARLWAILCPAVLALVAACSSNAASSDGTSATRTLRAAAEATAQARSFDLSFPSVEVTYNAPDTVEQVEHGPDDLKRLKHERYGGKRYNDDAGNVARGDYEDLHW